MKLRPSVVAGIVCCAALASNAAVVKRADETALQGDVVGLEKGNVIVATKGADGAEQRVSVPLEDVVEINFDPNATAPAPAAPTQAVAQGTTAPAGPRGNRKGVSAHFYNAQFWRSPKPSGAAIGAGRSPGDAPPEAALTGQDVLVILAAPDVDKVLPGLSNFFGEEPPAEGLNKDGVSAAFSGRIRPKESGEYTFVCRSDDDHWLLVDGKLVCSDPGAHGARDARQGSRPDTVVPIKLEAGKDYDFLFLANEGLVDFTAVAQWIPPGKSEPEDIPEDCLFADSGPPAAPSELKVASTTDTGVTLAFKDVATNEIRYQVDRATDPDFVNSASLGTAPINASTFADKDLTPGVTYYYRIRAVNFEGASPPAVVAARPAGAGQPAVAAARAAEPPAVPRGDKKGVTAQFFNGQYWRSPSPIVGGVRIRDTFDPPVDAAVPSAQAPVVVSAAPDASTTLATLNNNFAEESPFAGINRDDVSAAFTGRIRPKETGEYTFVCTTDDDHWLFVDGKLVCSDPGPHSARDAREGAAPDTVAPVKLEAGKDYDFVFLVNEGARDFVCQAMWIPPGRSEPEEIPEECLLAQTGAPAAPTDLRVAETTDTGVTLAFKDNSASEIRFSVDRDLSPQFTNPTPVGSVPINGTKFVDKDLRKGVTYYYRIRAVNFDGRSAPVVIAATPGVPLAQQQAVAAAAAARAPVPPAATAARVPAPVAPATQPAAARAVAATPVKKEKGVSARYYNTQFWKGSDPRVIGGEVTVIGEPDVSATVSSLNNAWEEGSPDPKIPNERFSTIFFGKVKTGAAGTYSILGFSDDDHYLYVNGKLVSVDTGAHGPRDPRGGSDAAKVSTIELAANTEYDLLYLQNENIGGAAASVMWIPPGGQEPESIPEENLSTATGAPAAPSELAADASAGNEVKLTFKDVATNEIRYTLERAADAGFSSQRVVNYLPINATSYTDTTVAAGNTYFYRLTAVNFEGQSPPAGIQVTAGQKAGTMVATAAPAAGAAPNAATAVPAAARVEAGPKPDAEGFVPIFNGKDLSGWKGVKEEWKVEDGAITANVPDGQEREGSDYLVWENPVQDFELRLKFKVVGMNSGIQFRSRITDEATFQVAGYQADIEDYRPITGTIWDQGGSRGTVGELGQKTTHAENSAEAEPLKVTAEQVLESVKSGDWNDMTITAVGNTLTVKVNGVESTVAVDNHPAAEKSGVLALQLDHYRPGSMQFKDVRLKRLGATQPPATPVAAAPATAPASAASTGTAAAPPAAASQPAQPADAWTFELAGGDKLSGAVRRWDGKQVVVAAATGEVAVPVRRVRQAWRGADAAAKGKPLVQAGVAEDTAFVQADNNEVRAVRGVVLGVEGDSLNFRFGERDRKIALDRLVGIALGETEEAAVNTSFHQSFLLASGDVLSGAWVGLAAGVLELRTPWDAKLSVPVEKVSVLKCRNGRLVYLSDLTPAAVQQVPYFDRMLPFQVDRSLTGGKLKLADGEYDKGIAVHSRTVLRYDAGGAFARLTGKVGFQDPEGKAGNAAVRIVGDGKTLFDRPEARGDQPPEEFDVDVSGVKALSLEVDFGRGQDVGDRVVWANPRLLRAEVKK
jgi:fibronectin type 3 domain-containing protein